MTTISAGSGPNTLIGRVNALAQRWSKRNAAMRRQYSLLRLTNDLQQPNMESVISSDPRTGYNFAMWLLTPKKYRFVSDKTGLSEDQKLDIGEVESFIDKEFSHLQRRTRLNMRGTFLKQLLASLLAGGWYSVIAFPTPEGWVWQVWNPATVYPLYDENGDLVELGRIYTITGAQANEKIRREGWIAPAQPFPATLRSVKVYVHWKWFEGRAWHGVSIGNHTVKPHIPTIWPRIPIYTGPAGGLPDDGSLMGNDQWTAEVGQGMLAPVLEIQKNYDKVLTYLQQLLRDVSNPRTKFWSHGTSIDPDEWYKRGAFFELAEGEDIESIASPPVPAELRAHLFDLRAQIQRSQFSDMSFGAVQGRVSAFLMSSVTATARQILAPYEETIKAVLGEIATNNIMYMRDLKLTLDGATFPSMPDWVPFDFVFDILVPGDLMQRASAAKTLNPAFRIPSSSIMEFLFPEIQNPIDEFTLLNTEDTVNSPTFRMLNEIEELESAAVEAADLGDDKFADRLNRAAQRLEAILLQPPAQAAPQPNPQETLDLEGTR
jgi:hypothetical protein